MGCFARAKNLFTVTNYKNYDVNFAGKASLDLFESFFKIEHYAISQLVENPGKKRPLFDSVSPDRVRGKDFSENPFGSDSEDSLALDPFGSDSEYSLALDPFSPSHPDTSPLGLTEDLRHVRRAVGDSQGSIGGSSTRRHRRYHHNRHNQYTNKDKRSAKYKTIKHHKSYRKHNRTIKRRSHRK